MSEFKLIKDCGLIVQHLQYSHVWDCGGGFGGGRGQDYFVSASGLENLLKRGVKVYESHGQLDSWHVYMESHRRREGLVIGIKPIEKPDTAEGLLREWLECANTGRRTDSLYERAIKLLEPK